MKALFVRFISEDQGQDLIEYALLGSFVAIAALTGATLLGDNLDSWYNTVGVWVSSAEGQIP